MVRNAFGECDSERARLSPKIPKHRIEKVRHTGRPSYRRIFAMQKFPQTPKVEVTALSLKVGVKFHRDLTPFGVKTS